MSNPIKVKFVSKNRFDVDQLTKLPNRYSDLVFTTDPDAEDYDWLVVYDDLPRSGEEKLPIRTEKLRCPPENTILITYEPSSIKFYGQDYINQYEYVLTSQEPEMIRHPGRLPVPPVGFWYYGQVKHAATAPPTDNKKLISIFLSNKAMKMTLHTKRVAFQQKLIESLPEIECFGRDYRYVKWKRQGVDPYQFHIAVENHIGPDHWTEKLSDSFLGLAVPFYIGCTNLEDYFPKESFISLDMRDTKAAIETIRATLANNDYQERLPALIEARRRVLEEYNLPNFIGSCIEKARQRSGQPHNKSGGKIRSRHMIMRFPLCFARYGTEKIWRKYQNKKRIETFWERKTNQIVQS